MGSKRRQPLFMDVLAAVKGENLTPADKLILTYLAYRQGRNGDCRPAVRTIAEDLSLSKSTVEQSIERLRRARLIVISKGRGSRASRYTIQCGSCTDSRDKKDEALVPISGTSCTGEQDKNVPISGTEGFKKHSRSIQRGSTSSSQVKKPRAKGRKPQTQPFTPPTVDEVLAYADSRGDPQFDAEGFVRYYSERDWIKVNSQPVLDWKGTVRAWIDRDNRRRIERGEPPHDGFSQYGTHPFDRAEAQQLVDAGIYPASALEDWDE